MPHGAGQLFLPNGDVFEGVFEEGRRADGEAKITYSTGEIYEGEFVDEVPHGKGTCKFTDGSVYSGQWSQGLMQGNGSLTFSNGAVYNGEFRACKRAGRGTMADGEARY